MPDFLSKFDIMQIHEHQIEAYGGTYGVRDEGLLESALAMPEAGFGEEYFHKDVFEMAAAYLFHIVQNHPFHDGNKRVGAVAALVFLELNGYEWDTKIEDFEGTTLAVARGELNKDQIAGYLRTHSQPLT